MGKVRKLRKKYHLSKVEEAKALKQAVQTSDENTKTSVTTSKDNVIAPSDNIFAGLDISLDSITKTLPKDFDARSVVSTKSRKELKLEEQHLKKKVKQKLRHERFLQKLNVTQQAMKDAKERKKKKGKPVTGDLNPLLEALPSLKSLLTSKFEKEAKESKSKLKGVMKMKKRLKQQTADAKLMKKIFKDKKFQANPGQTITEFLKQKVAMGK
ncbi:UNVERIFIED_CONTAM: hypothetical protein PYX00_001307 [Menopon gallinae]|uniref:Uncharacterized protein n=1 Tax=Menopon gallinae TaxID=328185 RepID=A0AAW2ICC1_9NEOP